MLAIVTEGRDTVQDYAGYGRWHLGGEIAELSEEVRQLEATEAQLKQEVEQKLLQVRPILESTNEALQQEHQAVVHRCNERATEREKLLQRLRKYPLPSPQLLAKNLQQPE